MAWPKILSKEDKVPDPEKKPDEKPPDKPIADIIAESLKPLTEGFASLSRQFEELRKPPEPPRKVEPSEIPSVLDDENAAFGARLTPVISNQLSLEARLVRDDIEKEYRALGFGELWDQHRAEINKMLEDANLVAQDASGKVVTLRGNPEYVRNVADMVIGRAARKGGIKFNGEKSSFFLEDASGSADKNVPTSDTEGLTKRQLRAAQNFGIPAKDYKASLAKLEVLP